MNAPHATRDLPQRRRLQPPGVGFLVRGHRARDRDDLVQVHAQPLQRADADARALGLGRGLLHERDVRVQVERVRIHVVAQLLASPHRFERLERAPHRSRCGGGEGTTTTTTREPSETPEIRARGRRRRRRRCCHFMTMSTQHHPHRSRRRRRRRRRRRQSRPVRGGDRARQEPRERVARRATHRGDVAALVAARNARGRRVRECDDDER